MNKNLEDLRYINLTASLLHFNIRCIIEKTREFQKNIYFCFIDYAKAFDCVGHNKLWKILQEMGIPDNLTFLLRNLYAGQEATVRTGHGTTGWFQIGKGIHQGCILSLCLFNFFFFNFKKNFLTLQYCIGFVIYQHESATGIHVFSNLNPPPSRLPIPSL